MIQYDLSDAIKDLREYPSECRKMIVIENDLKDMKMQLDSFGLQSGGLIHVSGDKSNKGPDHREADILDLIEKEENKRTEYAELRRRLRLLSAVLASLQLDQKQIKALYLRCEYGCTFGTVAGILRISPVEAWQMIRDIEERFTENYKKIQLKRSAKR